MIYRTAELNEHQLKVLWSMIRIHWILNTESVIKSGKSSGDTAIEVIRIADEYRKIISPIGQLRAELQDMKTDSIQAVLSVPFVELIQEFLKKDYSLVPNLAPGLKALFEEILESLPGLQKTFEDAGVYDPDIEDLNPLRSGRTPTEMN
jgi:hypothetical protein